MEKLDNILIVKVGSSTVTAENNRLDTASFERIGQQVLNLEIGGYLPVIVTSAAITAGMAATGMVERPSKESEMPGLQRLASIGWRYILNEWDGALVNKTTGGLLLTKNELSMPTPRDEALRVIHDMLTHGDIPIVNENDAITHDEIAYGDNDTLAATLAAKIAHSTLFGSNVKLVLLSDIDGVYENIDDPSSIIRKITDLASYEHLAGGAGTPNGSGGMTTKFDAGRIALASGVSMWIANGRVDNAIARALAGEIGTHFTPNN